MSFTLIVGTRTLPWFSFSRKEATATSRPLAVSAGHFKEFATRGQKCLFVAVKPLLHNQLTNEDRARVCVCVLRDVIIFMKPFTFPKNIDWH